jgi:hypothetical protein
MPASFNWTDLIPELLRNVLHTHALTCCLSRLCCSEYETRLLAGMKDAAGAAAAAQSLRAGSWDALLYSVSSLVDYVITSSKFSALFILEITLIWDMLAKAEGQTPRGAAMLINRQILPPFYAGIELLQAAGRISRQVCASDLANVARYAYNNYNGYAKHFLCKAEWTSAECGPDDWQTMRSVWRDLINRMADKGSFLNRLKDISTKEFQTQFQTVKPSIDERRALVHQLVLGDINFKTLCSRIQYRAPVLDAEAAEAADSEAPAAAGAAAAAPAPDTDLDIDLLDSDTEDEEPTSSVAPRRTVSSKPPRGKVSFLSSCTLVALHTCIHSVTHGTGDSNSHISVPFECLWIPVQL